MLNTRVWPMPICVVGWDQRPKNCGLSVSCVLTSSLERLVCSAIFCIGLPTNMGMCSTILAVIAITFFAPTRAHPHTQRCLGLSVSWMSKQQLVQEDDDVSTVLKGVSSASLEALNFVDYLNQKYDAFTTWCDFYWIFVGFSWNIHGIWSDFCRGCLNFRFVLLVVVPANQKIIQVGLFTRMKRTELPDRECGRSRSVCPIVLINTLW